MGSEEERQLLNAYQNRLTTVSTGYALAQENPSFNNITMGSLQAVGGAVGGTVALGELTFAAAAGDAQAQTQLAEVGASLVDTMLNIDELPVKAYQYVVEVNADADRLASEGRTDEAQQLRAKLATELVSTVIGGASVAKAIKRIDGYQELSAQADISPDAFTTADKPDFYVGPDGPEATLPSTGYRYDRYLNDDGTPNKWGQQTLETGTGRATYIGTEKFETGQEARDAFQIKGPEHVNPDNPKDSSWSDARLRGEFDTLQLYDETGRPTVRVPDRLGDQEKGVPEPITEAYPEFGKGGATQLHADGQTIKYDRVDILPENESHAADKGSSSYQNSTSKKKDGKKADDEEN